MDVGLPLPADEAGGRAADSLPSVRHDVAMSRDRLSGFVRPAKRQGKDVRGLWELWVCLAPEPATGKDGLPILDARAARRCATRGP